jgi:hypothetical protein
MILKHCFTFLQSIDLTAARLEPLARYVDSLEDQVETYSFILKLNESDRHPIDNWRRVSLLDESGHEFPQDERFRKAMPIAPFSTIAEHWGEYAEDAISEDAAITVIIREFLEAYDTFAALPTLRSDIVIRDEVMAKTYAWDIEHQSRFESTSSQHKERSRHGNFQQ